jgi:hypothetical protein
VIGPALGIGGGIDAQGWGQGPTGHPTDALASDMGDRFGLDRSFERAGHRARPDLLVEMDRPHLTRLVGQPQVDPAGSGRVPSSVELDAGPPALQVPVALPHPEPPLLDHPQPDGCTQDGITGLGAEWTR